MTKINLTELAYNVIKENVLTGKIEKGRILEVAPLSRVLSISRTPVSIALMQLSSENVLAKNPNGRGYVVGLQEAGFRADIDEGDVWLPQNYENAVNDRGRAKYYPKIEAEITTCLPFGLFSVNVTKLASHYEISRSNAHTALMRLERLGLVRHEGSRWFAGPLSKEDIREHYEMRWILEPVALRTAYKSVSKRFIEERLERAIDYRKKPNNLTIKKLVRLEQDLHADLVTLCGNRQMAEAIRRSQAPIIWSNFSFERHKSLEARNVALDEHIQVLEALSRGDISAAAHHLESHIKNSFRAIEPFLSERTTNWDIPPYLKREDGVRIEVD